MVLEVVLVFMGYLKLLSCKSMRAEIVLRENLILQLVALITRTLRYLVRKTLHFSKVMVAFIIAKI